MRTTGILRLVLNTKIWPGMIVDRASTKSLRISAVDSEDGTVKVFLIMVSTLDDIIYIDGLVQNCSNSRSYHSLVPSHPWLCARLW